MQFSVNQEGVSLLGKQLRALMCMGAIVSVLAFPSLTFAVTWQLDPTIALEGGYNDNFRLTTEDPDSVFSTIARGTLGLSRITDTLNMQGIIGLDFAKYFGDTDRLKDEDNNQLVAFKATQQGERFKGRFGFSYRRDTLLRSTAISQDPENIAVEDDQSVDDGLFTENVRRNRIDVRPSLGYQLTEITELNLGYRYENTFFGDALLTNVTDFERHTLSGEMNTRISENNYLLGLVSASRFDSDSGKTFDTYELQAGVSHNFDETTNATFTLGGRHTKLKFDDLSQDDNGFVFRLLGTKETGLTRFNGVLERTVSPSGSGDLVKTDSLRFNMTHELSELLYFRLRSRIFENESLRTQKASSNRRSLTIEPSLVWSLAENWSLDTSYRYRREKRFDNPDSADSNAVLITLTYQPRKEVGKF